LNFNHSYHFIKTIFTAIAVNIVLYGHAQTDTSSTIHEMNDVVVTGQYGEGSISQSVYKVKVIDTRRIELQGAVNIGQVLQNELNVRIYNDPVLGSGLNIQGIGGQNIKIMVDGVPVIGREGGAIDLNQINVNRIDRIEMVEGPMSVNFGTDALGGVINIITKKDVKPIYTSQLTTYYETIGQYNIGLNNSFSIQKWNIQLNGARNFFDGYNTPADSRNQLWKPREHYFGDASIGRQFKNASIRYQFQAFDEKVTNKDSGVISPWSAYAIDQYYFTRRQAHSIFYNQRIDNHYTINIVASSNDYRRVRNSYRKDLVSLEEQLIPSDEMQDTSYNKLWMSRGSVSRNVKNARLNYEAGYEINLETFEGDRILNGKQQMDDYNAFGSVEWKASGRLLIRPGVRYIYNTQFNAPLVPSVNMKWDVNSFTQLRASYAKGFRAPSLKELYLDFVDPSHNVQGNPNLDAETSNNYQLNMQMQWSKFERVFRVEPGVFFNDIRNRIDLVRLSSSSTEVQYFNINEFQSGGATINTEYRAPHYTYVLGYAFTGTRSAYNNQIQEIPVNYSHEVRFNLTYKLIKYGVNLSSFIKYNSRIIINQYNMVNGVYEQGFISGFTLWDITANKTFFGKKLETTIGFKNILNIENVDASIAGGVHSSSSNSAATAMGRTFFISLKYNIFWKS
jgi:outer membrane receptor for ferrienterochelin and colicins